VSLEGNPRAIIWLLLIIGSVLVTGLYAAAPQTSGGNKDEQEIRALEDRFAAASRAKDVPAIMKGYAPGSELFVFDVSPPRQYVGFDAYKKDFEDFFAAFPGPVDKFEVQDLSIATDGKLAFSHSIQPGILTAKDGSKFNLVARVTDTYRKINGQWLITHEHVSIPVDLNTGKADPTSKP
jgi:ketosteroid isomerase-like protein